jgi:hypothetical protein
MESALLSGVINLFVLILEPQNPLLEFGCLHWLHPPVDGGLPTSTEAHYNTVMMLLHGPLIPPSPGSLTTTIVTTTRTSVQDIGVFSSVHQIMLEWVNL